MNIYSQIPKAPRTGGHRSVPNLLRGLAAYSPKMVGAKTRGSFKKGGKVPATGAYKLHKGEHVLTAAQAQKLMKTFSRSAKKKNK